MVLPPDERGRGHKARNALRRVAARFLGRSCGAFDCALEYHYHKVIFTKLPVTLLTAALSRCFAVAAPAAIG